MWKNVDEVLGFLQSGNFCRPRNDPSVFPYIVRLPCYVQAESLQCDIPLMHHIIGLCSTSATSPLTVKTKPAWILAAVTCFCWLTYRSSLYCGEEEVHYSYESKVTAIISNKWPISKAPTSFVVWLPSTAAPSFPCFTYCPLILHVGREWHKAFHWTEICAVLTSFTQFIVEIIS